MSETRLQRLYAALQSNGFDAIALNPGPSLTYLTGLHFHLMERPVVMLFSRGKEPAIVLPELETAKISALDFPVKTFPYGENPGLWDEVFRQAGMSIGLNGRKIGIEPRALRMLEFRYLRAGMPEADFPDATPALAALRVRKEAGEISKMRTAVKIAQDALEAALPSIKLGITEKELANELVIQLLRFGSEPEMPFSPIVSSGPNSANPHASPTGRKLQAGDLLVVDWGASHAGYISDLTRTFAVGEVDSECHRIFDIVQQANAAGRGAGGPGVPCAEVDRAARAVIETAGYGPFFTHRTGHGIGMEGHEDPYMRGDNLQLLEPGMAYTVEPGIYLPERNSVRIEDNLVVTESGVESLSNMPRGLRSVG
jgi:Xaa-Pro dipeptidase